MVGLDDAGDGVALDELTLLLCGLAERRGGEAVNVPHGAEGGLVQQDDLVGGKQLAFAAGATLPAGTYKLRGKPSVVIQE